MKNKVTLVAAYLRARRLPILFFLVFSLIFAAVFYLYRQELEAILYADSLCCLLLLPYAIWDLLRFCKRHRQFVLLQEEILCSVENLPLPKTLSEADYHALVTALHEENSRISAAAKNERQEMTDYYSLWVHQIKIPISAMRLLLQSENGGTSDALSAELFKTEQYVEMVLSYIRLGTDSTDYVIRHCNLESIVRGAVRKYAPLFIRKKLTLDLQPMDLQVLTDEKWLSFVVEQLLSNAIKYTKRGKVTIYADAESRLIIEDSGIGIAPEDLPRLCEKGFTGYNGRDDKKATGLGLYLCKRVLTRLSHRMRIESAPGRGTRVILELGHDELHPE